MNTRGVTIWLTGLSGAGKTTLAHQLQAVLRARGCRVEVLDGDVIRTHLSKGLGFSREDRDTNIRRIGFVCDLLTRNGVIAIAAAISPYRDTREEVRRQIGDFLEVYVRCPLEVLIQRDVKGLYAKALRGEIPNFTGISDPYEEPLAPEVICDTDQETVEESVAKIVATLERLGYLPADEGPVPAHGGRLVNRFAVGKERQRLQERLPDLPVLRLSPRSLSDLLLIANGGFSPLEGFLVRDDYERVVREMRLANGLVWSLPITLPVPPALAATLRPGDLVALAGEAGPVGVLEVADLYRYDKQREAELVYRTTDLAHPGVRALFQQEEVLVGGPVWVLERPLPPQFGEYELDPAQTRRRFRERGWRQVVGFQTRNPVHRAHEYLQKVALEIVDGLLLHPLVGETKSDDLPAAVRMRCYEVLLRAYYPADRVLLAVLPAAMRYAGPREAVFHALVRKNYGCTHFIVGRDHAGVGSYYGTYDAHRIFEQFRPDELGITPFFFEHAFYCRRCGGMASTKTCPHDASEHVVLSGTKVRAMLQRGESPPPEFTRPEVAAILVEAAQGVRADGPAG